MATSLWVEWSLGKSVDGVLDGVSEALELVAESETAVEGGSDRAQQDQVDDHQPAMASLIRAARLG